MEIKFRAWNGKKLLSPARTEVEMSLRGFAQSLDFILMQYTGLKDKDGKEIYEGDILQEDDIYDRPTKQFYEVKYNATSTTFGIHWSMQDSYKIIGNIYENPELLKKQS